MYQEENKEPEFLKRTKTNPFRTPDRYFDSVEERIMAGIRHTTKNKTLASRVFQLMKPALGLVASFTLVYILVYYPINSLLLKNTVKTQVTDSTTFDLFDAYSLNFSLIDENTLVNTIFSDETNSTSNINPDDMLAYLSSGMNDLEIYSEIQN